MQYINIHNHIFTMEDDPTRVVGLITPILRSKVGYAIMNGILRITNPFTSNDSLDRMMNVVKTSKLGGQKEILEQLLPYYNGWKIVILPMDMTYMGAGKVKRPYVEQLDELVELMKSYPIIPFIAVDPRREGIVELVEKYFLAGFGGIKLYCSLGYFPDDDMMNVIYKLCIKYNKPIITHCTPDNPIHFKGSDKELRQLLLKSKFEVKLKGNRKELCSQFTNPDNYVPLFLKYPKLRIDFAHGGGATAWFNYLNGDNSKDNWHNKIKQYCKQYEGAYFDISYTNMYEQLHSYICVLMQEEPLCDKMLFGGDYYCNLAEGTERIVSIDLRCKLGLESFNKIASINCERFLC